MSGETEKVFRGKTIVVSGASSGIGRAVAVHLARQGAGLVLVARDRNRLEETAQLANAPTCRILELDLTRQADIMPAIKATATAIGKFYGFCHAAGTVETLSLSATSPEKLQAMMQVNYLGGMELARAVTRRDILNEDGGSILFISAIYGLIGKPGQIAYSGSKGAVTAASRAMAIELARRNIRVNVLSPGIVRTKMTEKAFAGLSAQQIQALKDTHPLGFGNPEDVASAAAFLLAPESKWITGADLVVDGGCSAQ
ncbi:MAG TPA: SDR family oxidoreductase [Nitrospiraceae bacterium]|nr:SDR family oxidoreductase [Nitrospiraceae bacterium]